MGTDRQEDVALLNTLCNTTCSWACEISSCTGCVHWWQSTTGNYVLLRAQ